MVTGNENNSMATIYRLCADKILLQRFFLMKAKVLRMFLLFVVILMISIQIFFFPAAANPVKSLKLQIWDFKIYD